MGDLHAIHSDTEAAVYHLKDMRQTSRLHSTPHGLFIACTDREHAATESAA